MRRSFLLICIAAIVASFIPIKEKDLIGKYISHTKVYIDTTVKKDWIPYQAKDSLYYLRHGMKREKEGMRNFYSFKIELALQDNHGYSESTSNDFLAVPFISTGTWKLKNDSLLLRETNTEGHQIHYTNDPTKDYDQLFIVREGNLWEGRSYLKKLKQ